MTLELGGLSVLLSDTAGLREDCSDLIEREGMLRAASEARRAQLQLWVYDANQPPTGELASLKPEGGEEQPEDLPPEEQAQLGIGISPSPPLEIAITPTPTRGDRDHAHRTTAEIAITPSLTC